MIPLCRVFFGRFDSLTKRSTYKVEGLESGRKPQLRNGFRTEESALSLI